MAGGSATRPNTSGKTLSNNVSIKLMKLRQMLFVRGSAMNLIRSLTSQQIALLK
jgi:hypothetical protein